jgi:hypothetical protein
LPFLLSVSIAVSVCRFWLPFCAFGSLPYNRRVAKEKLDQRLKVINLTVVTLRPQRVLMTNQPQRHGDTEWDYFLPGREMPAGQNPPQTLRPGCYFAVTAN